MAIPDSCKELDAKFYTELNKVPPVPANIQFKPGRSEAELWNKIKDVTAGLYREHIKGVRKIEWVNLDDTAIMDGIIHSVLDYLKSNSNFVPSNPYKREVIMYAFNVNTAYFESIVCIENYKINIPQGQTDIITHAVIDRPRPMVDFHGERAKHRYYTEETYISLNPKKNPFTRADIDPDQVMRYIGMPDESLPVQEAGRKRSKKSRKTRRRHK